MDQIVTALILCIPLAALAWFAWSCTASYQRRRKIASLDKLVRSNRYRGITIRNGKCKAVRHLTGQFFQPGSVPELPVDGCNAMRCSCMYAGLNNRRHQERRSTHDLRSEVRYDPEHTERRSTNDRRKSGRVKWQDPAD